MTSLRKENYGKINREKVLGFNWDNKEYFGYEGDSLASALLANAFSVPKFSKFFANFII